MPEIPNGVVVGWLRHGKQGPILRSPERHPGVGAGSLANTSGAVSASFLPSASPNPCRSSTDEAMTGSTSKAEAAAVGSVNGYGPQPPPVPSSTSCCGDFHQFSSKEKKSQEVPSVG